MLDKEMLEALNEHLNFEMYSAYVYLAMTAYLADQDLDGFANWMKIQTQEELLHADKFFNYINERGGRVKLQTIENPAFEWDSPLAAFEDALEHEREVTRRIYKLVDLALKKGDHGTNNFLQWFIAEQIEEEASVDEIVKQLRMINGEGHGLLMLNRDLASRVLEPAAE